MNIGNKKIIFGTTATILIASINAFAISANLGGNIGVGTANKNADTGLALQGYLEVDATPNIAVRGAMIYYDSDIKVDVLSEGDFTMFGPEASVILKLPCKQIVPYIGAGAGFYMAEHNLSGRVNYLSDLLDIRIKEDINSDIGLHAMGGVNVILASNFSLDFNVKYIYFKPEAEVKVTNLYDFRSVTVKEDVDFSALFLTAGLKITF